MTTALRRTVPVPDVRELLTLKSATYVVILYKTLILHRKKFSAQMKRPLQEETLRSTYVWFSDTLDFVGRTQQVMNLFIVDFKVAYLNV